MAGKVRFSDIEQDITAVRSTIEASASKQDMIDKRLSKILGAATLKEIAIDTDDDDFEAVHRNNEAAQANIASLIHGLDEITQAFGKDFSSMAQPTIGERVMGVFSKRKSEEMKSSRIRNADIRQNLNELIRKSDVIETLLQEQLAVIDDRLGKTKEGIRSVQERAQVVARELEALAAKIDEAGPKVAEIDARLEDATGEERKKIEAERTQAVEEYVSLQAKQQEQAAVQQSLERYSSQYSNYIESLTKQSAAQRTLIEKLKIDREQRSVMYDALVQSIKTSEQQNIAHRIDDVGRATDAMAEEMITQHGISAENRIAGMLESHEIFMKRTQEVRKKGQIANDQFLRRFGAVLEKVDTGRYAD